jgi:putative N-acetyltransferase (TIGR04045 family)
VSGGAVEVRVAASLVERRAHMRIRRRVFVEEQRLFERTDRDPWDASALHVVAIAGGEVLGAVRLYALDEAGLWKGDRLAVLPGARTLRMASDLVRFAVATAGALGGNLMVACVQVPNVPFFARLGWDPIGRPFEYHGVPHRRMTIGLGEPAEPADAEDWTLAWGLSDPRAR